MFREMGQLASLMRNMGKIKEETEKFKTKLGEIHVEGTSGGGMVMVKANGRLEVMKITITPEAFALQDREMLEDLVASAVNVALDKAREKVNVETQAMAANLGLPNTGELGLPGLG